MKARVRILLAVFGAVCGLSGLLLTLSDPECRKRLNASGSVEPAVDAGSAPAFVTDDAFRVCTTLPCSLTYSTPQVEISLGTGRCYVTPVDAGTKHETPGELCDALVEISGWRVKP